MKCKYCNGKGEVERTSKVSGLDLITNMCVNCQGSGTIDWIEKITGKKQDENDPLYPLVEILAHHTTKVMPSEIKTK